MDVELNSSARMTNASPMKRFVLHHFCTKARMKPPIGKSQHIRLLYCFVCPVSGFRRKWIMKIIRPSESPAFTDLMTALLISVNWALSVRGVMRAPEHTARPAATNILRSIGLFPLPNAFRLKRAEGFQHFRTAIL